MSEKYDALMVSEAHDRVPVKWYLRGNCGEILNKGYQLLTYFVKMRNRCMNLEKNVL